jgi:hypothetical protein
MSWLSKALGIPSKKGAPDLNTDAEMAAIQELAEEYGVDVSELAEQFATSTPQEYDYLGDLEVATQDSSALEGLEADPRFSAAELKSLEMLEQMSDEGLTATDRADLAKIQGGANRNLRGQMGAIKQNMQSRGISGSGLDLMSQQNAAQAAAERQAYSDLEVAAQGQSRRERATMDLGALGSQLSQQDYNREAQKAMAQDAINRFNTQNTNRANEVDRTTQQGIANKNVGLTNQQATDAYKARMAALGTTFDARSGNRQLDYDRKVDQYNRDALAAQQSNEAGAGQMGAITGIAGGVLGGIYGSAGGPAGTIAGAQAGSQAGSALGKAFYAHGGKIPGETNGVDSYADDTVEIMVQPGEIVIPETVATSPEASAEFVARENGQDIASTDNTPNEDIVGMFIETVNNLSKKRR